ncbi:MAG TPA: hypothetical protein VLM84_08875 [Chromatiaceae bacterium]|jgi:hypothetical protein|nr:hypothetical protein [Chromatiaceae bacterium]
MTPTAPEDLAAYVEALAVKHGGIAYGDLMALATEAVSADHLLLAAEGLVNCRTARLMRVFVDQASGANLPEEDVRRLLGLAADGDQFALDGVEVVYRPVSLRTDTDA